MLCTNDMMTCHILVTVTPGVLQSFPLKEISSRDFGATKSRGVSNGKENVSNKLIEVYKTSRSDSRVTTQIYKRLQLIRYLGFQGS